MLLLIVGGLVVVLCTYYFVFLNFQERTETLEAENVVLEDVIVKLKDLDKNREQYLADTEKYTEDIERIKDEFPAGKLGELMQITLLIKTEGLTQLVQPLKRPL